MASANRQIAGPRPQQQRQLPLDRRKDVDFVGKSFYLDLPHGKQTLLLTKAISRLGGVIESFLSRDVNYVVTGSRKASDADTGGSGDTRKDGRSKRPAAENTEPALCRGKQLLRKVIQKQECSSVVTSARSWGVCVLHLDEVLEQLERSNAASKVAAGKNCDGAGQTIKIAKLKPPFLKIEDQSQKYRPLQFCFSSLPEISYIASGRSPFEAAQTKATTVKEKDPGDHEDNGSERSLRPHAWEKKGFCECCQVTYTKLSEHVLSEQHARFARDASNYKVIDDIVCRIATCDLVEFPHGFKPDTSGGTIHASCDEEKGGKLGVSDGCEARGAETPKLEAALGNDGGKPNAPALQGFELQGPSPLDVQREDEATEDPNNVQNPPKEPLQFTCDAGAASHIDVVTEVSWYTQEMGLTSVYTVQSVILPPEGQLEDLTMVNTPANLNSPPLLSYVHNPLGGLVTECFGKVQIAQGPPVPGEQTEVDFSTVTGPHCSDLLVEQPLGLATEPSSVVHLLDAHVQLPGTKDEAVHELAMDAVTLHKRLRISDVQNESLLDVSGALQTNEQPNVISFYKGPAAPLTIGMPAVMTNIYSPGDCSHTDEDQLNLKPPYQDSVHPPPVMTSTLHLGGVSSSRHLGEVSNSRHLGDVSNTNEDRLNLKPPYQDPVDHPPVMTSTLHLGEVSNTNKVRLNLKPPCQDRVDPPAVMTSICHLGEVLSTDEDRLNLRPPYQDSVDPPPVMTSILHLGEVSNIRHLGEVLSTDEDRLNPRPPYQDSVDPPPVMTSIFHLGEVFSADHDRLNPKPPYQDSVDPPPVMTSMLHLGGVSNIRHLGEVFSTDEDQLTLKPPYQDSVDPPPVMTSIHYLVSSLNTGVGDQLHVFSLNQDPVAPPVVMPIVTPQCNDGNMEDLYHFPVDTTPMSPNTSALTLETSTLNHKQQQSATDSHSGKRKQTWSPCHPPAKRPPCPFQPVQLPMWLFRQFSNTGLQLMDRESGSVTKDRAVDLPSSYFNPKLIQYIASSEPEWVSGLLPQQDGSRQQDAQYRELCACRVNLDNSWYGRQLCSVLAHEQSLGPSSTQGPPMPRAACDLYLSGVAS